MAAVASLATTGCVEETFPEGGTATQEQVGASAAALESSLRGIPTQMTQGYFVYGDQVHETDMSYAGLIIAQAEMLGDGIDWSWLKCRPVGKGRFDNSLRGELWS